MNLLIIQRLIVLSICICICVTVQYNASAQQLSPYDLHQLLRNDTLDLTIHSQPNALSIVNNVANGSTSSTGIGGGEFVLTYIPNEGFVGNDTLTYSYWILHGSIPIPKHKTIIYQVKPFILNDDYFIIHIDDAEVEFDVLANDISHVDITLQHLVMVSSGTASISDDNKIVYTPYATSLSHIRYVACDDLGYCESANVKVLVKDGADQVSTDTVLRSTLKNHTLKLYLPDNGYDLVQGPENGTIEIIDDIQFNYIPNNNYHGSDEFEFSLITDEGEFQIVFQIAIINYNAPNLIVVDDFFNTTVNVPIACNVFDNDILSNFPIQHYSQPQHGSLSYEGNGVFNYTPNDGFIGVDVFTYRICPMGHNQNCETAVVTIRVNNLKPEAPSYRFTTAKNIAYIIRYLIPITSFEFEVLQQAEDGILEFYPGQQTVIIDDQEVTGFNMLVYYPAFDFIGEDEMRIKYCVEGDCKEIKVYVDVIDYYPGLVCYEDCVWPGDINNDGRVDMMDLLPLGYYLGKVGSARSLSNDHTWLATYADNWGPTQMISGVDMKHADADGDGIVSAQDTASISGNYMKYHRFTTPYINPLTEVPFYLIPKSPIVEEGELAEFDIVVGSSSFPAYDYTGLSFNLNFDGADFIDTSTIAFEFKNDNWLSSDVPFLDLTIKPHPAQMDAGIARADGRFASGFGIIGKLEFIVVRDIDGFHPGKDYIDIPVHASHITGMINGGNMLQIPNANASVRMYIDPYSTQSEPKLSVYPNPAYDNMTIYTSGDALIQNVEIISMSGQLQSTQIFDSLKIVSLDINNLVGGMYAVRATTDKGVFVTKAQILR